MPLPFRERDPPICGRAPGPSPGVTHRLREALGLWRGEALADVAEAPFAVGAVVRRVLITGSATGPPSSHTRTRC